MLFCGVYDCNEVGFQWSTTNQWPVNVFASCQVAAVVGGNRASIQNSYVVCNFRCNAKLIVISYNIWNYPSIYPKHMYTKSIFVNNHTWIIFCKPYPQSSVNFLCLFGCCSHSSTDCPYGLIRNYYTRPVRNLFRKDYI